MRLALLFTVIAFLSTSVVNAINDFTTVAVVNFIQESRKIFLEDENKKGFLNIAGVERQVISTRSFIFIEGAFRFAFVNGGLKVVNGEILGKLPAAGTTDSLTELFQPVEFGNNEDLEAAIANNFAGVILEGGSQTFFDNQDAAMLNYAAVLTANAKIARGPFMFCLSANQCKGARVDNKFGSTVVRDCNGLNVDGVVPTCDSFVALFSIHWLFGWIVLVYIIIVLWAIYMLYPKVKRIFVKKAPTEREDKGKPTYSDNDKIVINTLAVQIASAENMLFQATDMLKQAKNMKNIVAVEARRESKVLTLVVEFYQAMAAAMVSLTHQYLHTKTFTPGEKFNDADPAVRALQLEVLNYVGDRLKLAFQAEPFTEKSLLRIAEAYAVLKKVSEGIVLVGFTLDKENEEGLGELRTPVVDLTENAFFLSGIFKAARGGMERDIEGAEICVPIKGNNSRGMKEVGALYYLSDSQRDCEDFDPQLKSVTGKTGKHLVYNLANAGTQGETLQYFVRTFWGPEIAQIQTEATSWLQNVNNLESWLARERAEREKKAAPAVKRGAKKKRRKHKKNEGYEESDDAATMVTEYTEASGWSVANNNTFVYSVSSVVNQGLGISGQPGIPFKNLGIATKKTSRAWKFFEAYFPNAAEWPKFYFIIFVLMPFLISITMLVKTGLGAAAIDIDGNVAFKARPAGFGTSFLGVQAYYCLDCEIPELDQLDTFDNVQAQAAGNAAAAAINNMIDQLDLVTGDEGPFGDGLLFMDNKFAEDLFLVFDGGSGRNPDAAVAEIQSGILVQRNVAGLDAIRNQVKGQEYATTIIYALMHTGAYFFGIIPISLVRESLEIFSRCFPFIRSIYPMSQWRELHMNMGLAAIFYVTFGATAFLVMSLVSMGRSTPFSGFAGDPNIGNFFDLNANVLYLRQLLLPGVPLLLLMKYASRGPPTWMLKFAPKFITMNYWEICYFLHYLIALTSIIMLVLYRPQVFYWMGATWGFLWGGNKIVRILRTRKCTINGTNLVSYSVEDKRNNSKARSDVLRLRLNVPRSFPQSSRGQACWLTVPEIDFIAHPFTLAKVPTNDDHTIMFHIGIKYLRGDDETIGPKPESNAEKKPAVIPIIANPNELPPGWKSAVDPQSGQTYYYNSTERKTTWNRPKNTVADNMLLGVRALTSRFSANILRDATSAKIGQIKMPNLTVGNSGARSAAITERPTWTQRLAVLGQKIAEMTDDMKRNQIVNYPVYVSAPLGTSMDDCLLPSLPGSIIITTQNGLPAAESSVRWLLMQKKENRPKFHFFVSVSREVNDALSVLETLRDVMCDAVVTGNLDIDGVHPVHAHMADWLGVYIHLTRRKPSQIEGDREMLMKSLNPTAAPVSAQQLELIEGWLKNRVRPGRLDFDRFLQRASQLVTKRTGMSRIAVGYCGSAPIAYAIRAAAREVPEMTFDGEYI